MFTNIYLFVKNNCINSNRICKFLKVDSTNYSSCYDIYSKIKSCEKYTESYLGPCHPFTILYDGYKINNNTNIVKHGNKFKIDFRAQTYYTVPNDLKFFYQLMDGKIFKNNYCLNVPQMIPFNIYMFYLDKIKKLDEIKKSEINIRIDVNDWFCFLSKGEYHEQYFEMTNDDVSFRDIPCGTFAINLNSNSIFYQNIIFIKNSENFEIFNCCSTFSHLIKIISKDNFINFNKFPFDINLAFLRKNKILILCEMKKNENFIFNLLPLDIIKIIFNIA